LNVEVEQGMAGAHIIVTTHGYDLAWRKDEQALDQMLGPIARSAAVALTSAERGLVRQCASDTCGWLFVDATKNHRRQWCSMTACGNRARVRRHRQRQRAGGEPGDALADG
jgi:predicted RNA-binding Zn ribbon-like protein